MVRLLTVCLLCAMLSFGYSLVRAEENKTVELKIWETYNDEEHDLFLELVNKYMTAHPDVKVVVQQIPYGGHRNKILTALATRTTPDIARIDNAWIPKLAPRNAVMQLDEFGAQELGKKLVKAAFDTCLYDNKVYGLPDQVTCLTLFYNKDMFKAAGLDPEAPPKTWEEFIAFGKKLTDSQKSTFGFGMGNTLWEMLPFYHTFGARALSADNRKCTLDSPEAIKALQLAADLYQKEKIEAGAWMPGAISSVLGFKSNKYAMIFTGPWNIQNFKLGKLNFGVGLIPAGPAGSATNVGGTNMVIFKGCKNPKAAYEFLQYLSGVEFQKEWAEKLSQIPVNLDAYEALKNVADPYLKVFMEQIKTAYPIVGNPIMDEVEAIVNPETAAALKGDKTVDKALKDAVVAVNKKLDDAFAMLSEK